MGALSVETCSIAPCRAVAISEGDTGENTLNLLLDCGRFVIVLVFFHLFAAASAIALAEVASGEERAMFSCLAAGCTFTLAISNLSDVSTTALLIYMCCG
jgi:hypothetical protein